VAQLAIQPITHGFDRPIRAAVMGRHIVAGDIADEMVVAEPLPVQHQAGFLPLVDGADAMTSRLVNP
jgi:hypothetical protein